MTERLEFISTACVDVVVWNDQGKSQQLGRGETCDALSAGKIKGGRRGGGWNRFAGRRIPMAERKTRPKTLGLTDPKTHEPDRESHPKGGRAESAIGHFRSKNTGLVCVKKRR